MRVGIFNVKYSPNLGDGLLSECLEVELGRVIPGLSIESFDLAGRTNYGKSGRFRAATLRLLQSSPGPLRQSVVGTLLGRSLRQLGPTWRARLKGVDVAVTGGGNLFSDADLNFPLKIDAAWSLLREADIPVAVFAVGVSDNWSEKGAALFRRALSGTQVVDVSVRDSLSAEILERRLGYPSLPQPRIVRDPGLLVSYHVPQVRKDGRMPRIGLGLTHPTTLRYHSDEKPVSEASLAGWYSELVRGCLSRGWEVCVFTNGSTEDQAYLRKLGPVLVAVESLPPGRGRVTFAPRFMRPAALASYISGLDLLMAHRLHANIAAYSYKVPLIGFTWDVKVASFFALIERPEYLCTAGRERPEVVLELADRCLREGLDPARHGHILTEARADVATLAEALKAGAASRRRSTSADSAR